MPLEGREVAMFEMQSVLEAPASSKKRIAAMAAFLHLSVATVVVLTLAWKIEAVEAPTLPEIYFPVAFLPAEWKAPIAQRTEPPAAPAPARPATVIQPTTVPESVPAPAEALAEESIAPLTASESSDLSSAGDGAIAAAGGVGSGVGVAEPGAAVIWHPGIVPPQVLFRVDPKYPELARSVRRQGTVLVEAEIATDGSLRSARVVSTPLGFGLEQSALDAVRAWRFAPARYGERPVAVYYRWNILFTLR